VSLRANLAASSPCSLRSLNVFVLFCLKLLGALRLRACLLFVAGVGSKQSWGNELDRVRQQKGVLLARIELATS
jgi:hypothetical protein